MYATVTSILTLLPGLPQSAGAEGYTKITNRISQHITRAEAIINAIKLKPNETKKYRISYKVKYPKDKVIGNL